MTAVFGKILEMSATASIIIVAVLLVRLLLSKAPKKYSYILWSVVAFRLVCPVSFRSAFSILRIIKPAQKTAATVQPAVTPDAVQPMQTIQPTVPVVPAPPIESVPPAVGVDGLNWLTILAIVWCVGMAVMLCLALINYLRVTRRMSNAMRMEGNVWQSEMVRSPFVSGIIRPSIYIPFGLDDETMCYALAHERCHLRRLDHVTRLLAYIILTVHWFNPLCWIAYFLMVKDMEMSCDEAVLRKQPDCRKAYCSTLLSFAANKRFPAPNPLAFGETEVKRRMKNILNWKKPSLWATVAAIVICVAVLAACAADPAGKSADKTPSLVLSSGEQSVAANWYPDGQFDFEYDELNTLYVACYDEIYVETSFDTEMLTVGEDYYKLYMGGTQIEQSTYELTADADGNFEFDLPWRSEVKETTGIYYIPYGDGKFVVRVAFAPEKVQEQVPEEEVVYTYTLPQYYGTTALDEKIWNALQPRTGVITETTDIPMLVCNCRNMFKTLWQARVLDAESAKPNVVSSYITDTAGLFNAMNISGWETVFDQVIDRYIDREGEALFTAEHTYELNFYSERIQLVFITGTDVCGYKFIDPETGRPTEAGVARIPEGTAEAIMELVSPGSISAEYVESPYTYGFTESAVAIYSGPGGGVKVADINANTIVPVTGATELDGELWLYVQKPFQKAPGNDEGWIAAAELVEYTDELASRVDSPIYIAEGTALYCCTKAAEIPGTEPEFAPNDKRGSIVAKEDGYCQVAINIGGAIYWVAESDLRPDVG